MANEPYSQGTYAPSVPPTVPGPLPVVPTTKWPTVLGVIAILFATLDVFGEPFVIRSFGRLACFMGGAGAHVLGQAERAHDWTMVVPAVTLGMAALLAIAGVGLVNRRQWGVTVARDWAVVSMALAAISIAVGWHCQGVSLQSSRALSGQNAGLVQAVQGIGALIGLAWSWTLPAIMLAWLSRPLSKIEVATWK